MAVSRYAILVGVGVLLLMCRAENEQFPNNISSVKFGKMRTVSKTDFWTAYHISEHRQTPGNFFISTYGYLGSFLNQTQKVSIVVGDRQSGYDNGFGVKARFQGITSFVQINESHILLTDLHNHLVRAVNLDNRSISWIAGQCEVPGYKNGEFAEALFDNPQNIIDGEYRDEYLLTDKRNHAIRILSLKSRTVKELVKDREQLRFPFDLIMNFNKTGIYVTVNHGLVYVDLISNEVKPLSSLEEGNQDGEISTAKFSTPLKLTAVSPSVYVIADRGNNKLRVFNDQNLMVSSICKGHHSSIDGDAENCTINKPYSVFWSKRLSVLVIGAKNWIRKLELTQDESSNTRPNNEKPSKTRPATSTVIPGHRNERVKPTHSNRIANRPTDPGGGSYNTHSIIPIIYGSMSIAIIFLVGTTLGLVRNFIKTRMRSSRWPGDSLPRYPGGTPSSITTLETYHELPVQHSDSGSSMDRARANPLYDVVPPPAEDQYLYPRSGTFSPTSTEHAGSTDTGYLPMNLQYDNVGLIARSL